jgi:hypothetical protein
MPRGVRQSIRGTKKKPRRKRADVTRIGSQAGGARRTSFAGLSAGKPSYAACLTKFQDTALPFAPHAACKNRWPSPMRWTRPTLRAITASGTRPSTRGLVVRLSRHDVEQGL